MRGLRGRLAWVRGLRGRRTWVRELNGFLTESCERRGFLTGLRDDLPMGSSLVVASQGVPFRQAPLLRASSGIGHLPLPSALSLLHLLAK